MAPLLSYAHLLECARTKSAAFTAQVDQLKTEYYQMSAHYLRMGWHAGFEDYYASRREVHTLLVYAERDLERSRATERKLSGLIAAGEVRPGPVEMVEEVEVEVAALAA